MKYLKSRNEIINEGIFGDFWNWLKGIWKSFAADIQKLDDDPNKIKEYINSKVLPTIINKEIDKFKTSASKNTNSTVAPAGASASIGASQSQDKSENQEPTQNPPNSSQPQPTTVENVKYRIFEAEDNNVDKYKSSFDLVDAILNTDTGLLGKKGIGMLFNDKSLQGDKMKVKRLSFEFIINTARDEVIKTIKFNTTHNDDLNDKTYLPTLKEILLKTTDATTDTINWIKTNITDALIENVKAVREDDIKAAVAKGGVVAGDYKVGDMVKYKMDGYDDNKKPEDQPNLIGEKAITAINGDNYSFKDTQGKEFIKTKDKIISKAEGNTNEAPSAEDLKTTLAGMAKDDEAMKLIKNYADFIKDKNNRKTAFTPPIAK